MGCEYSLWNAVEDSQVAIEPILRKLELPTSNEQLELLARFRAYYATRGLLSGGGNPELWACCEDGKACWAPIDDSERVKNKSGITLPWIGAKYHQSRIAVVAHNLRDAGGLLVEQQVVSDTRRAFAEGRKKVHNTVFAYRSFTAVNTVLTAGHVASNGRPDPASLLSSLDSAARIQAVKCAPRVWQSTPSPAMAANCPPRYLRDELTLLAPRTLIALGRPVREALQRLYTTDWTSVPGLTRGWITLGHDTCEVFCIAHPSARSHWWPSYWALRQALVDHGTRRS